VCEEEMRDQWAAAAAGLGWLKKGEERRVFGVGE